MNANSQNRTSCTKIFQLLLCILIAGGSASLHAKQEPPVIDPPRTVQSLSVGDIFFAKDPKFAPAEPWIEDHNISTQKVKAYFRLFIDHSSNVYVGQDYLVKVDFKVKAAKDAGGNPLPVQGLESSLTVEHKEGRAQAHIDEQVFLIENAHEVEVEIVQLTVPQWGITIPVKAELVMEIERYQVFVPGPYTIPQLAKPIYNSANNEVSVSWSAVEEAEFYHLEWMHVNNYGDNFTSLPASQVPFDFSENATRITTTGTGYTIPAVFERGYLLFRIRAMGLGGSENSVTIAGEWSCGNTCSGMVSNLNTDHYLQIGNTIIHEGDNLNWQFTANYAEEGKKKEAVSYFDSSLRNRQTVSKINSDDAAIVGETVYDHQGRAAIQVLPAPVQKDATENDPSFRYYKKFNKSDENTAYSRADFDLDSDEGCALAPAPMHTSDGASQYYSPDNPDKNGHQAYVPDAEGYPFTHVEFTPDNTGRIRRQGGVGKNHQLGSGHETKYFYGKPLQEQLDRLFGAEVGYAKHYKKNMVVDANKQVSVSYLDPQGRVIATALAGDNPPNLKEIDPDNGIPLNQINANILDNQPLVAGASALTSRLTLLVSSNGNYDFHYKVTAETFTGDPCLPADICMDCVYDIVIDIQDDCGIRPAILNASDGSITTFPIKRMLGTFNDIVCETSEVVDEFDFQSFLEVGNYNIVKKLIIHEAAYEFYRDEYFKRNSCNSLEGFWEIELAKVDFSGCKPGKTCLEACQKELGENATAEEINACVVKCEFDRIDPCKRKRDAMLADLTPGGQYARYQIIADTSENGEFERIVYKVEDRTSILFREPVSENVLFPGDLGIHYSDPAIQYEPSEIELPNGNTVDVHQLSIADFITFFQDSWAEALLPYHPEYCNLDWCDQMEPANEFEQKMRRVETFEEALQEGLMNPFLFTTAPPDAKVPDNLNSSFDPFFDPLSGRGADERALMESYLLNYPDPNNENLSIWQMAAIAVYCNEPGMDATEKELCHDQVIQDVDNYYQINGCADDRLWEMFRALYLAKRMELLDVDREFDFLAGNPDCGNWDLSDPPLVDTAGKRKDKRFPFMSESMQEEGFPDIFGSDQNQLTEDLEKARDIEEDSAKKRQCESYVANWMEVLAGCEDFLPAGQEWKSGNGKFDSIAAKFVEICIAGTDPLNMLGATSVPDTHSGVKPPANALTTENFRNFEDVIEGMLGKETPTCAADLIMFPHQWGHSYDGFKEAGNLDTCACSKVLQNSYEFDLWTTLQQIPLFGFNINFMPQGVDDEKDLFEFRYGIRPSDLSRLECVCNQAFNTGGSAWAPGAAWEDTMATMLRNSGEYAHISLLCESEGDNCLGCEVVDLRNAYLQNRETEFKTSLADPGYIVPQQGEEGYRGIERMWVTYLNNLLDADYSANEYLDLIEDCEKLNNGEIICDQLSPQAKDLLPLMDMIARRGELPKEACLCAPPYIDPDENDLYTALFGGHLDNNFDPATCNHKYKFEEIDINGILVGKICGPDNTCNLSLEFLEPEFSHQSNRIIGFFNLRPIPGTLAGFTNAFLVDADVIDGDRIVRTTMRGETDCFPIAECIDDPADKKLCLPPAEAEDDGENCKKQQYNIAKSNTQIKFRQWKNQREKEFRTSYVAKCLRAKEVFDMEFDEQEYHYTLYYYDQSGNLVRTIPPEGVVPVTDAAELQAIKTDRDNGVRRIFTKHRMASTYTYNSLNQLIFQAVPDNDLANNRKIMPTTNGLAEDNIQNIEVVHLIGNEKGFLIAEDPDDNTRSVIYKLVKGKWERVNDLGLKSLKDAAFLGNTGLAVGEEGAVIKSEDGGESWTLINTSFDCELVKVHFMSSFSANDVRVFCKTGIAFGSVDGGVTWGAVNGGAKVADLDQISDIHFTDVDNGYMVGIKGTEAVIYYSSDGGNSWTDITNMQPGHLNKVQFTNGIEAYAAGIDGTLLKTSNNGINWKQVAAFGVSAEITGMFFSTSDKGVVATDEGIIYYTNDGGQNFQVAEAFIGTGKTFVHFINVSTGFAVTENGHFASTFNGGQSWTESFSTITLQSGQSIRNIYFENSTNGYVVGSSGLKLKTGNGGFFWSNLGTALSGSFNDIYVNGNNIYLSGDNGLFSYSTDGGQVWNNVTDPDISSVTTDWSDLLFTSANEGYALNSNGNLYRTTGFSFPFGWDPPASLPVFGASKLRSVDFMNSSGLMVGEDGTIARSGNGGASWTLASIDNIRPLQLEGIHAFNTTHAVAVGEAGTILYTQNGGNNWQKLSAGTKNRLVDAFMDGSNSGGVVGDNTALHFSSFSTSSSAIFGGIDPGIALTGILKEGSTWYAVSSLGSIYRRPGSTWSLEFGPEFNVAPLNALTRSANQLIAVGGNGSVVGSADGISWSEKGSDLNVPKLLDTHADGNNAWAVGDDGTVLVSHDAGQSWKQQNSGTGATLNSVAFDGQNGVAVGTGGIVIYTSNNGDSWNAANSGTAATLNDVDFADGNTVYAVGNSSTIIKSTNKGTGWNAIGNKPNSSTQLNAISIKNHVGYVVGNGGAIWKTENFSSPGSPWVALTNNGSNWTTATLNDVLFNDYTTGYVVGNGGVMLKTTDGGLTWEDKSSETSGDIKHISFHGSVHDYTFGGTGQTASKLTDLSGLYASRFWYDKLGRLVASQNSKQFNISTPRFSYTKYDVLGRIIEVGELASSTEPDRVLLNNKFYPNNWSFSRFDVTSTFYDQPFNHNVSGQFGSEGQQNLRSRIASVTFEEAMDLNLYTYDHGMHYSYDIHGNVKRLVQENFEMISGTFGDHRKNRFKRIDYDYDLVSGNVKRVTYQPDAIDQFIHEFDYDADNRILSVRTSKDGLIWDSDAEYDYYEHGPLARAEIGHNNVQGVDYAYTIQGWLKGVNSSNLDPDRDIGKDGNVVPLNGQAHLTSARDAYGFVLGYFNEEQDAQSETRSDYKAILSSINDPGGNFIAGITGTAFEGAANDLFNGNIRHMVTALPMPDDDQGSSFTASVQGTAYQYDQLNRLRDMAAFRMTDPGTNSFSDATDNNDYKVALTYDANGNIETLKRNATTASGAQLMDDLTYKYPDKTIAGGGTARLRNQLLHVRDNVPATNHTVDIDDQGSFDVDAPNTHNYTYDEQGNLIADKQEEIANIEWNAYGKIRKVIRTSGSAKPDLEFGYDGNGNRSFKIAKTKDANGNLLNQDAWKYTFYVRDAQGQILATYSRQFVPDQDNVFVDQLLLNESHLYGSARLGLLNRNEVASFQSFVSQGFDANGLFEREPVNFTEHPPFDDLKEQRNQGEKFYELTNHLGNVLAVVSDRKLGEDENNDENIDYFSADVLSVSDYYPFGQAMLGRSFNLGEYRFGFNGQEQTDEIAGIGNHYIAAFWEYSSRTVQRWNIDPKPNPSISPYAIMAGNPIWFSDPMGDTIVVNNIGYITRQDRDAKGNLIDNYVFTIGEDGKLKSLGELGKKVNVDDIYSNLLKVNSERADDIWSPWTFRDLVKGGGEWDLKVNRKTIFGLANLEVDRPKENRITQFSFKGQSLEAQDIGNHHFGVVGKATGLFSEYTLLYQAGKAQINSGTSRPEWQKYQEVKVPVGEYGQTRIQRIMLPPYGDDPRDQKWIKEGFKHYNKHKPDGDWF